MSALIDTPEFSAAKDALATTLERAEQARQSRLKSLQDALNRTEDELERVRKQALELPTYIARYRAEIARLEATTGGDILREAMGALKAECWGTPGEAMQSQPQPEAQSAASVDEPFVIGLAPEALRKVWPEWEDRSGDVVTFKDEQYRWAHWHPGTLKRVHDVPWEHLAIRPRGATRAHVEALAQQAQTPKPHTCPRCDRRMHKVEVTHGPCEGEIWRLVAFDEKADVFTLTRDARTKRVARTDCRFIAPSVPPQSEWCDGSGKGGAE